MEPGFHASELPSGAPHYKRLGVGAERGREFLEELDVQKLNLETTVKDQPRQKVSLELRASRRSC